MATFILRSDQRQDLHRQNLAYIGRTLLVNDPNSMKIDTQGVSDMAN